jgi:hypothetical protein
LREFSRDAADHIEQIELLEHLVDRPGRAAMGSTGSPAAETQALGCDFDVIAHW